MWNPLLEAGSRAEAFSVIESISTAIRMASPPALVQSKNISSAVRSKPKRRGAARAPGTIRVAERQKLDASLASGSAGLAILFAYLERARPHRREERTFRHFLAQAVDDLSTVSTDHSLFGGRSAWPGPWRISA